MLNVAVIMGRLVADPELRHTPNDIAVTSFTVAVDRSYARQGTERQTDFIDVVAWRQQADFVCKYFTKGQMIAVTGSIQTRTYEDRQGNKRKAVEIQADRVSFCGSKRESGGVERGTYEREPQPSVQKPAAFDEPALSYANGDNDDYEEVLDNEDLPF